jgi:hypothetical protein
MDSGIDGLFGAGKGSINKIFKDSRKWLLVPAPGFRMRARSIFPMVKWTRSMMELA